MNIDGKYLKINLRNKDRERFGSAWFSCCQQLNKPCVLIKQKGSTSSVEWDSVTLPQEYDVLFMSVRDDLEELAIALVAKHNFSSKIPYVITANSIRFSNIPNESAGEIAEGIFNLIETYKLEL